MVTDTIMGLLKLQTEVLKISYIAIERCNCR